MPALTSQTNIDLNDSFTFVRSITSDGSKFWIKGTIQTSSGGSGTQNDIRRYTLAGVLESAGNINNLAKPSRPSGVPSGSLDRQNFGIHYYNGSFYLLKEWYSDPNFYYSVHRYNTSFVHQEVVCIFTIAATAGVSQGSFTIYDGKIYLKESSTTIRIRNLSDGNFISGTNSITIPSSFAYSFLAVSSTRIYLVASTAGVTPNIRVYDHSGTAITADDTNYPSGVTNIRAATTTGSNLYIYGTLGST